MKRVVVDASVGVKWVIDEPGSDAAAALLDGHELHVPDLFLVETANALWAQSRRGAIGVDAAETAIASLLSAPLIVSPVTAALAGRAFALAAALRHPVYDCIYLALALDLGAPVVTDDGRFLTAVRAEPDLAPFVAPLRG